MRQLIVAMAFVAQGFSPASSGLPSFGEPEISPDGSTTAFLRGADRSGVRARGADDSGATTGRAGDGESKISLTRATSPGGTSPLA